MLIPFLFLVWLVVNWVVAFSYFYKMLEEETERTFKNFILFVWLVMWFVSIIIVNKSLYDLFMDTAI